MPTLQVSLVYRGDPYYFPTSMVEYCGSLQELETKFISEIFSEYFSYDDRGKDEIEALINQTKSPEDFEWECKCDTPKESKCEFCDLKEKLWERIVTKCREESENIAWLGEKHRSVLFRLLE